MNAFPPNDATPLEGVATPFASRPVPRGERQVGDYLLERRLGSGAMGEVWLARHVVTRGRAALKMLHPHVASQERVQRFFARERRAVARLAHPHVVQLHKVAPEYIVTAYIQGADLSRRLRSTIDPATAVRITLQIASALAHAHARGVVHRDVKPSNILIDRNGNAYLTDFGLAAILDDESDRDGGATERAGTPTFMAPEQLQGITGPAGDQYALGRTLLEMLAGGTVSDDSSVAVEQLPGSLPPALKDAVRRATAQKAEDRWPSVEAFAGALASVDLRAYPPPVRLAPEARVRAGFDWCTGAHDTHAVTHEIERGEFRLSDLERAGLLSPAACEAFREATGYADVTWAAYANRVRIGSVTSAAAFARASDLVVLLHGMFCTGEQWEPVAAAICRDNAQAIVLVPDLYGCGESRYDLERVRREHVTGEAIAQSIVGWLDLLGVRELPTVLVGHSASGAAILCVGDEAFGERTSRIAVTPFFLGPSAAYRFFARTYGATVGAATRIPGVTKMLGRGFRSLPDFQTISEGALEAMVAVFERSPPKVIALLLASFADARPVRLDATSRCLVLVGDDDPVAPAKNILAMLESMDFPIERVEHLVGAAHMPHLEHRDAPEITARNIEELARHVESMLSSSREGSPLSTAIASTVFELEPSAVSSGGAIVQSTRRRTDSR